jgi:hypothetical protein
MMVGSPSGGSSDNQSDNPTDNNAPENGMAKVFWKLVKGIWDTERIPENWQAAVVVPVPKKGDLTLVDNYRGIALMSVGLKVVATVIARRVQRMAEAHGLIRREQAGFRWREEGAAQTAALYEILVRRKLQGLTSYACFIDFSKAYDKVPQEAMLYKLRMMGIGGGWWRVVRGVCRAEAGGEESEWRVGGGSGGLWREAGLSLVADSL